ncbi:MAG TPA: TetR/AcrR family transcriptional regulator [Nocardioidaceae bacterium]|nr:TetR/AcrR family transcriptional regulator [Nocardioidaceae bacterium]
MSQPTPSPPAAGTARGRDGQDNRSTSHVGRKRQRRTQEILHTAALAFAERGYDGANFEDIAARMQMRGPSLYYYFGSKEELLRACLDQTAEAVTGRAHEVASGPGFVRTRLRRLFADQLLVQLRDFPEFIALFLHLQLTDQPLREHIHRLRRAHGDVYRALVEEGIAAGELDDGARRNLLHAFGALAYVDDWYRPGAGADVEDLADQVAGEVLRLFPRPRRPRRHPTAR